MAKRRANGTGSIYRDGEYWAAQIEVGYTDTGRRRYKKKRSKVQADVIAWLNAQTVAAAQGIPLAPPKATLEDYLNGWVNAKQSDLGYNTHKNYAQFIRDHINPRIGKIQIGKLKKANVQGVIDALTAAGKSYYTARNVKACLCAALEDCKTEHPRAVVEARAAKLPRKEPPPPKVQALTPAQARTLLAAVEPERLKALYWVALIMGLRQSELLGLRVEDVNLEEKTLRIAGAVQRQKGKGIVRVNTKNRTSETILPLPAVLIPVLREHLAQRADEARYSKWKEGGLLLTTANGTALSARNVYRRYTAILAENELPAIRFHDLRHSCASLLIKLKVHPRIIMEIMRHAQISTTMNIYGHAIPEENQEALDLLGDLVLPEVLELPPQKRLKKSRNCANYDTITTLAEKRMWF